MQHIEGAINRVPVLEKTGIKSTVCGPGNVTAVALWWLCSSTDLAGGKGKLNKICRRRKALPNAEKKAVVWLQWCHLPRGGIPSSA